MTLPAKGVMLAALGAVLLMTAIKQPRGIRNNNPANLENNGIPWQGLAPVQSDSRFYQFQTPEYGIRAAARVLKTYQNKYGINTVRGVIERWAPPHENNTDSYVNHVASVLGVGPDDSINIAAYLVPLTEAIIVHENGQNPYSMAQIVGGVALA
jgi:hypothetical protein